MKTCSNTQCQMTDIPDEYKFCPKCGTELKDVREEKAITTNLYYYIDYDHYGIAIEKGPYTIQKLRDLHLSIETLIWSEGWAEYKPISKCHDVMESLVLTPPEIPDSSKVIKSQEPDDGKVAVHPDIHWFPKVLLYLGILFGFAQVLLLFENNMPGAAIAIDLAFIAWGVTSIFGMLAKKRWALISYFTYRFVVVIIMACVAEENYVTIEEATRDYIRLIIILLVFLIKKNGHNVYELLWNNGVFYVEKECTPEEQEKTLKTNDNDKQ